MNIIEPYHDDEAKGVLFEVVVDGRRAQGYISCATLAALGGPASHAEEWVASYRRNQPLIDAAVARRVDAENWDTVMVGRTDLAPAR